eukprot:IDg3209t1
MHLGQWQQSLATHIFLQVIQRLHYLCELRYDPLHTFTNPRKDFSLVSVSGCFSSHKDLVAAWSTSIDLGRRMWSKYFIFM